MTLSCPECQTTDIQLVSDNGAEYPETRVEFYECNGCGYDFREVLAS